MAFIKARKMILGLYGEMKNQEDYLEKTIKIYKEDKGIETLVEMIKVDKERFEYMISKGDGTLLFVNGQNYCYYYKNNIIILTDRGTPTTPNISDIYMIPISDLYEEFYNIIPSDIIKKSPSVSVKDNDIVNSVKEQVETYESEEPKIEIDETDREL